LLDIALVCPACLAEDHVDVERFGQWLRGVLLPGGRPVELDFARGAAGHRRHRGAQPQVPQQAVAAKIQRHVPGNVVERGVVTHEVPCTRGQARCRARLNEQCYGEGQRDDGTQRESHRAALPDEGPAERRQQKRRRQNEVGIDIRSQGRCLPHLEEVYGEKRLGGCEKLFLIDDMERVDQRHGDRCRSVAIEKRQHSGIHDQDRNHVHQQVRETVRFLR
jgi:hypothetical protein